MCTAPEGFADPSGAQPFFLTFLRPRVILAQEFFWDFASNFPHFGNLGFLFLIQIRMCFYGL